MQQDILFKPKLWTALKGYNLWLFLHDLLAGITVAIIAFPIAIAFGIASGSTPERGILAAVVGGFLLSLFSGSRVQIGGPTSPFLFITLRIIQDEGFLGLSLALILAGLFLFLMGFARLGKWIRYIPLPVISGFRNGIAIVLFTSQIKDLLGLTLRSVPVSFVERWAAYMQSIDTINWWTVGLSVLAILTLTILQKIYSKIPHFFLVVVLMTAIASLFQLPVETIGSRFGSFSLSFQLMPVGEITFPLIQRLLPSAFTLAIICGLEALLSATIADSMIGGKHRPNTELMAQGIASIGTGLVGGIPITGTLARTATNIRAGGKTPVSGLLHSFFLFLLVCVLSQWISKVPLASLSAILVFVSYNMAEWKEFKELYKISRPDFIVLCTTFFATIFFNLSVAIYAGMTLSLFLFMKRMSEVSEIKKFQTEWTKQEDLDFYYEQDDLRKLSIPQNTDVFELNGAFFFGAANKFEKVFRQSLKIKKFIILRMKDVLEIDATGLHILLTIALEAKKYDKQIIFTELRKSCQTQLEKTDLSNLLSRKCFHKNLQSALHYIETSA